MFTCVYTPVIGGRQTETGSAVCVNSATDTPPLTVRPTGRKQTKFYLLRFDVCVMVCVCVCA